MTSLSIFYLLIPLTAFIIQCGVIAGVVLAALAWRDRRAAKRGLPNTSREVEQRLLTLDTLRDSGAIDADEHQRQRQAIIAAI